MSQANFLRPLTNRDQHDIHDPNPTHDEGDRSHGRQHEGHDALGRRTSKTILGGQTGFLYDGSNPVQELSGTTVTANLLTGGLDEYFTRTDTSGARHFLTDALGSTLGLTDSNGTVQTNYTYEPFGNTTVRGTTTTSSFGYTGREMDGTGLYYYRARYYNPQFQRLISEDALGFDTGVNFYAYVQNNVVNLIDPLGLGPTTNQQVQSQVPLPACQSAKTGP